MVSDKINWSYNVNGTRQNILINDCRCNVQKDLKLSMSRNFLKIYLEKTLLVDFKTDDLTENNAVTS